MSSAIKYEFTGYNAMGDQAPSKFDGKAADPSQLAAMFREFEFYYFAHEAQTVGPTGEEAEPAPFAAAAPVLAKWSSGAALSAEEGAKLYAAASALKLSIWELLVLWRTWGPVIQLFIAFVNSVQNAPSGQVDRSPEIPFGIPLVGRARYLTLEVRTA